jgi:hypothetical protein
MVEAFGALGAEATAAQNLGLAYHRYRDAQTISRLLLGRPATLPGVESFLGQLDGSYEKAFAAGEYGVAWGLLDVMTELGTTTPQMRQHQRMTRDEIDRRAVRGLTAYPFEDPKNAAAKVGDGGARSSASSSDPPTCASSSARALERIATSASGPGTACALSTAGFIVRAASTTPRSRRRKTGSETRRVVTGEGRGPGVAWMALRARSQGTPEPATTIPATSRRTWFRKSPCAVGIISVSYRVIVARPSRLHRLAPGSPGVPDPGRGACGSETSSGRPTRRAPPDIEISRATKVSRTRSPTRSARLVEFLEPGSAIRAGRTARSGRAITQPPRQIASRWR